MWTTDEINQLIDCYEARAYLWDHHHKEYHNRDLRSLIYEEVDKEMSKFNISRVDYKRSGQFWAVHKRA